MSELIWKIPEAIYKYVTKPKLIIEELRVEIFRILGFTSGRWGKFIIAKITNIGGRRAENCIGHVIRIIDGKEREFKLHWCGESWEYKRDSAPKIDLEPTESRDLDIAFSYCGNVYPEGLPTVTNPPIPHLDGIEGIFIATPYVVENFEENSDAYLKPGKHRVEIRIILSEGEGFEMNFIIESLNDPSRINFDKSSIEYKALDL